MKVMISQPMRGKTEEQIRNEREELVKRLEADGFEVIDTILDLEEGKSPIYYLSKSIELLDQADIVLFMKGWETARGCWIEHKISLEYGKKIIYERTYMTEEEREALDYVKGQLKNGYIDITNNCQDEKEFNIVKRAIENLDDTDTNVGDIERK